MEPISIATGHGPGSCLQRLLSAWHHGKWRSEIWHRRMRTARKIDRNNDNSSQKIRGSELLTINIGYPFYSAFLQLSYLMQSKHLIQHKKRSNYRKSSSLLLIEWIPLSAFRLINAYPPSLHVRLNTTFSPFNTVR